MTDHRINYAAGQNPNFFTKLTITSTTYGVPDAYYPDIIIPFPTQQVRFSIESTGVVRYSFNGMTDDGEINSAQDSKTLIFDNRIVCKAWFRLISGSATIRIEAYAQQ